MKASKITSIETFRVFAIFAVICLHTNPFMHIGVYKWAFALINHACRFAVPYFFITSGFFFGKKIQSGISAWGLFYGYSKRLFILFFAWTLLYAVLPTTFPLKALTQGHFQNEVIPWLLKQPCETWAWISTHKIKFLAQGTSSPLWFLEALGIGLLILTCFIFLKKEKFLLSFSFLLFVAGLMAGPYAVTPLGFHFPLHFNTRHGPFFSTLFVAIGWKLSFLKERPSTTLSISLGMIGLCLQVSEALILWKFFGGCYWNDYFLGTVLFGAGVFLFTLSKPDFGELTIFPKWASLTLGIYVVHMYVRDVINLTVNEISPFHPFPLAWQIVFPLLVFFFSASFVGLLKKSRVTAFLVR
ncbi:MAG: acyltransferase [Candidatus Omnitrophota bacterium]|jgi:surface polysaccharide O-acyltransferase-like enzyme